jgi:hypothetical protein
MTFIVRPVGPILAVASVALAVSAIGCGGTASSMGQKLPISVSLGISRIVLPLGGKPIAVQINIVSTSETALVSVTGPPAGIQVKYAATDTNPSGTLTFSAGATAIAGTYPSTVTVYSAGQTASTSFTLVVSPASSAQGELPHAGNRYGSIQSSATIAIAPDGERVSYQPST